MRLYDISVPLSTNTPTYPGDPKIEIESWSSLAKGDAANVSMIHFGAHSGTHVDAPAHFIEGAARLDSLPLDVLIGEAQVIDVPVTHSSIDKTFVTAQVQPGTQRVLFKTRNSSLWENGSSDFQYDYISLEPEAAVKLVELGVRLVGIDYLSVEKFGSKNHETHLAFLSSGVVIVEGLNLFAVPPGRYELFCLPIKIAGGDGDGAPARSVLRELERTS